MVTLRNVVHVVQTATAYPVVGLLTLSKSKVRSSSQNGRFLFRLLLRPVRKGGTCANVPKLGPIKIRDLLPCWAMPPRQL